MTALKAWRHRALELGPLRLLAAIRRWQKQIKTLSPQGADEPHSPVAADLEAFLQGLASLWKESNPKPVRRNYTWHKPREVGQFLISDDRPD